jgi:uncharacterized membrane-anchored protein
VKAQVPQDWDPFWALISVWCTWAGHDPRKRRTYWEDLWQAAATETRPSSQARLGKPIIECTPTGLEVHRAIDLPGHHEPLNELPPYVTRAHDRRLQDAVDAAAGGDNRIVMLVGGSSTGKTRACWEAIHALPGKQDWWLWHPIDPSLPDAAATALEQVGPHTVVCVNEAQRYLMPSGNPQLGERVAAGLRTLLSDPKRGPVLVLGTMWPQYWATLTTRPAADEPDPYAQARELLAGTEVTVPEAFTTTDLVLLREAAVRDPRLRHAAEHADAGRITQHLAGVPELLARYRNASPVVRAVIHAAIDARRLGHPPLLPRVFLEHAAPGYLTDHEWNQVGRDWLEQTLAETTVPCHGVPGPLTRIRTRPGEPALPEQTYRLADYLEQTGSTERAAIFPPGGFWDAAAATITNAAVLTAIGQQAEIRGRYRRAAQLYQRAVDRGDTFALLTLAQLFQTAENVSGADALYRQAAALGDATALLESAWELEMVGDISGAEGLYRQAADLGDTSALQALSELAVGVEATANIDELAMRVADRGDADSLRALARRRKRVGDVAGAERLYRQAADLGDARALLHSARLREEAGDTTGAESLYQQGISRGDIEALLGLARLREEAGDTTGAESFYQQGIDVDNAKARRALAQLREKLGDVSGAKILYQEGVDRGDTDALLGLARLREKAGDIAGVEELAMRAGDLGDTKVLRTLAGRREKAGDAAGAESLYRQAADRGNVGALRCLARLREQAGDAACAEALYRQAIDGGNIDALRDLVRLREQAGDHTGADRMRRWGLTDEGEPAGE